MARGGLKERTPASAGKICRKLQLGCFPANCGPESRPFSLEQQRRPVALPHGTGDPAGYRPIIACGNDPLELVTAERVVTAEAVPVGRNGQES